MDNIFELRFSFEQKTKDEVIYRFSNKQGGNYNVFAYHWQCFAWAAVIGFLRDERRPLTPPIADKPFGLNTMKNNDGEKVAQALICMAIAKAGSLDIMKKPSDAINIINEYANGGFYHIMKLMENGENSFNDLEKVKQEIFSRDYKFPNNSTLEKSIVSEEEKNAETKISHEEKDVVIQKPRKSHRWSLKEETELVNFYQSGMTINQLAELFEKDEESVINKLAQRGINV